MIFKLYEYEEKVCDKMIQESGESKQKIIAIEEMSELTKELVKDLRDEKNEYAIAEEIADTLIMLAQMIKIYDNLSKVDMFIDYKINRMYERLKGIPEW